MTPFPKPDEWKRKRLDENTSPTPTPAPAHTGINNYNTYEKNRPHGVRLTHPSITRALRALATNSDIHILPADKGGATVVLDKDTYDREAMRQLNDSSTYQKLSEEEYLSLIHI